MQVTVNDASETIIIGQAPAEPDQKAEPAAEPAVISEEPAAKAKGGK